MKNGHSRKYLVKNIEKNIKRKMTLEESQRSLDDLWKWLTQIRRSILSGKDTK